jgi:PIN domain nuclease of toxin-antitoxin system
MKFIADTNAFIWFITDSPRLSSTAKDLLEAAESERFLSIASIWEISIKAGLGRLSFENPLEEFLPDQIARNQFALLNISLGHALHVEKLPPHHRDPFDRMIIAQSFLENIPVLSSDEAFDAYGIQRFW